MARQFEEQEFEASVSDQDGLLRCRVPTPMLKAMKAQHGDLIHFTMTGPDAVEIKIRRGRGFSGEKPYMSRETESAPSKKKSAGHKKSGGNGSAKASGGKKSGPINKPSASKKGKTKRKVEFTVPGFD